MKHGRFFAYFVLFVLFAVIAGIFAFVAMHLKSNDDVLLSLFDLPENLPYLYCEFGGQGETSETSDRAVLFAFWQNGKMHRITGNSVNNEWDFRAHTPDAQQVLDRANQLHARKARVIPRPGERDAEGRILASDAGLISRIMHSPNIPVFFKAELSKLNDNEYIMNFNLLNMESIIPAAWLKDLNPIKIKDFPFIRGAHYAHLASNITLMELVPQFQAFIDSNARDKKMSSSLRSMRGELYVTIGSANALWDGISIPALLLRFRLKNDNMRQSLFDFIHGLFDKKYELHASEGGYYSRAPTSLWLSKSNELLETGIIDRYSIARSGQPTLPAAPEEALLWLSFVPRYLAEAVSNFMLQISPDLNFEESLNGLNKIDNCTLTLNSIKSGEIRWKAAN